jgi:hypothetical protein
MIRYNENHVTGECIQWCSAIRFVCVVDEKMENTRMEKLINGR